MHYIDQWEKDTDKSKKVARAVLDKAVEQLPNLEEIAIQKSKEIEAKIDCLSCANCCKTTVTTFTNEDISKAAKFMGISRKQFINLYLISDMGEYTTISTPCPFLETDNKCAIYEARPMACDSFPHTSRKHFVKRKAAHVNNYEVCPITYQLLKQIEALSSIAPIK